MPQKTFTLHVHGMTCSACVVLTENELAEDPRITAAKSNLANHTVEITGDFGDMTLEQIATELTPLISEHGYSLSIHREKKSVNWNEFAIALPIAFGFGFLFILLQKLGIVNLVNTSNLNYGTAFLIGVVASVSSCMAVVGGLLLSMSATFAKNGRRLQPQLLFHGSRLITFFLLGGVIGAVGSVFQFGSTGTFVLGMIVSLVMLLLGINLLDIFEFTKRFQPTMPKFLSRRALNVSTLNHTLTPALVGVATFFLPCGFTQSMQIATLQTGNFLVGGLTMLAFALGTLPVLALVSVSSLSIQNNSKAGIFFKSAGLIVILFALFNLLNSVVAIGLLPPLFTF